MKLLAGRRVEFVSYLALAVVAMSVVVVAARAHGYPRHRAELNDGVIWVSNNNLGAFGRLNKPTEQLDGATRVTGATGQSYDVVQQGAAVLGVDTSSSTVYGIDVASGTSDDSSAAVPRNASITIDGGTLGVVDPATGKIWATQASDDDGIPSVAEVDAGNKPLSVVGGQAAGTVTADGAVVAASGLTGKMVTLPRTSAGYGKPLVSRLHVSGPPSLTSVGNTVVALDEATGHLLVAGKQVASLPQGSVLQQVGPAASSVLVATPNDLLEVDLADGTTATAARVSSPGRPAAPVRLGDCLYGAWSSVSGRPGSESTVCPDGVKRGGTVGDASDTSQLALRNNRGQVVLNDLVTGSVWNIDDVRPQKVDNWKGFKPDKSNDQDHNQQTTQDPNAAQKAPKAVADDLGARPGTTTVLHVLDNDQAPEGTLLAISDISSVNDPNAAVRASPDEQSVLLTLPQSAQPGSVVHFTYTVNAGSDKTAQAPVSVSVRGSDSHHAPQLRDGAVDDRPHYTVASSGNLTIPVLGDWRDPGDGDPVSVTSASLDNTADGAVHITADGELRFDPGRPGDQKIKYTVTDSDGSTADDAIDVVVQKPTDLQAVPPTAEPDFVRGVTDQPIVIRPLGNDVPGSDPLHPHADLKIAAPATPTGDASGLQMSTDVDNGRITVNASRPGTFLLQYAAGFGDASTSTGTIRVDVAASQATTAPVTVPDAITLFGDSQGVVDVLSNDYDPEGRVLVTQDAELTPGQSEPLEMSVIQGHWVRLRATGTLSQNPVTVHYHVSDGSSSGVEGDIVVRQAPSVDHDAPVTTEDDATVRSGEGVTIPVLDNDFTPSGAPVSLDTGSTGGGSGQLVVTGGPGTAYASGRLVRFDAPPGVTTSQTVEVHYIARHGDLTSPGTARVTIVPQTDPKDDQAPTPPTVEARAVAGSTVPIKIPSSGSDPDGDPVTVIGLASAPSLGRVIKFGATELEYQAFPLSSGTDTFQYQVSDPDGLVADGTVRVAVVPPGQAQPPVAVPDTFTAAPGRHVTIPVLANDYVAQGDVVHIGSLAASNGGKLPGGARLESPQGPIDLVASGDPRNPTASVAYTVSDGVGAPSTATVTVHSVKGYDNPPVVFDAFGTLPSHGNTVTIDALARAYDPDGPVDQIHVVMPAGIHATVSGGNVTLRLLDHPQVVPYTAADKDGGTATAFLYVPASRSGPPRLANDQPIKVRAGGETDVKLSDLVVDPAGRRVQLTLENTLVGAPTSDLRLSNTGNVLHVRALTKDYVGPASISFQVTDAAKVGGPGETATIDVPVQIGDPQPIFKCPGPDAPLTLIEGGETVTPDIAVLCHVWTSDPDGAESLHITGSTSGSGLTGIDVSDDNSSSISIRASADAKPTVNPEPITVTAAGTKATGQIYVSVIKAPPPTLTPVSLDGLVQGQTRTIEMSPAYFHSSLGGAVPTVVSITQTSGEPGSASNHGSAVSITPGKDSSGPMTFAVVMSDVTDRARSDRQVNGTIRVTVLGRPDQPGRPFDTAGVEDRQATLTWDPSEDNGAPVTQYTVSWAGGSKNCGASNGCIVTGLNNGTPYQFTVVAHNSVGDSDNSPPSQLITPDAVPGAVGNLVTVGEPADHQVTVSWQPPSKQTTLQRYVVSWPGHRVSVAPSATSFPVHTDDNNTTYAVSVLAANKQGYSDPRSITVQSSGKPATPTGVSTDLEDGADGNAKVTLSWTHTDWEGKSGTYQVLRNGAVVADNLPASQHTWVDSSVAYDGAQYVYGVKAINSTRGPLHTSDAGQAASFKAQGNPDDPHFTKAVANGQDQSGDFTFDVGQLRGTGGAYTLRTDSGSFSGAISAGQQVTVTRTAGANGSDVTPTVKVCNSQGLCSAAVSGPSITPYGPLTNGAISNFQTDASGTTVSYSATIDTNGRPATVHVTGDRGFSQTQTIDSRSQVISGSQPSLPYSSHETFTVTVSDSGRGSVSQSKQSPDTSPPPVSIDVTQDAGHTRTVTGCTSQYCEYIVTTTHNFLTNVSCSADSSLGAGGFVQWTQGPNSTRAGPDVFGQVGGWVQVTCSGGGQTATQRYTWQAK